MSCRGGGACHLKRASWAALISSLGKMPLVVGPRGRRGVADDGSGVRWISIFRPRSCRVNSTAAGWLARRGAGQVPVLEGELCKREHDEQRRSYSGHEKPRTVCEPSPFIVAPGS